MPVDPIVRTRLRQLTAAAFVPSRVESTWRPVAEKTAADFVDHLTACDRPADLMQTLAFPLPVQMACRVLGLPSDDAPAIRAWTAALLSGSPADDGERAAASDAFSADLAETVAWYEAHGDDGTLLADLISARVGTDRLSRGELVSIVRTMILAGHENAARIIGTGVFTLLTAPGEWERLGRDPGLVPGAVEGILLREVPGHGVRRDLVTEGDGIDYGLGMAVARTELHAAFRVLAARLPTLRLAVDPGEIEWSSASPVRGPLELPVTW